MAKKRRKTYPGHMDRPGRAYRWRVSVGGKRHTFSLHTTDRREAEHFARTKYAELSRQVERQREGLPSHVNISELFDQFEREHVPTLSPGAQRSYKDSLKPLRTYFVDEGSDPTVEKIRAAHVVAYFTWRRSHRIGGGTVSNRTIAKDRAVLHRIFALAEQLEYREGNPVNLTDAPKSDGRTPVILSDDEYEKLLKACEDRELLYLYVLTLGETGARCESEVLWTQWEDVDLEEGFLQVVTGRNGHRTKSGKSRWVPMSPRLTAAVKQHFARYRFAQYGEKKTPWVFHHTKTRRHHKAGERIRSLYSAFKAAADRAKLPSEFVQHDLRHRRVTTWLAEEKSVVLVREAVGHADLRTTMAYTHLAREHLRGLVDEPHREEARNRA